MQPLFFRHHEEFNLGRLAGRLVEDGQRLLLKEFLCLIVVARVGELDTQRIIRLEIHIDDHRFTPDQTGFALIAKAAFKHQDYLMLACRQRQLAGIDLVAGSRFPVQQLQAIRARDLNRCGLSP